MEKGDGPCRVLYAQTDPNSGRRFLVFRHALRHGLPLPIGARDVEMLDSRFTDADADETPAALLDPENLDPENDNDGAPETDDGASAGATATAAGQTIADFEQRAAGSTGCGRSCSSPRWQPTYRRTPTLLGIRQAHGPWEARRDAKLAPCIPY